ncbi:unnamed protein product [Clavelina lepadiformis]|uniref:Secreted protein n=1 Tax=Clavelina lepadiformis TaxID=159417 RepID=A0ABP0EZ41_CLALP
MSALAARKSFLLAACNENAAFVFFQPESCSQRTDNERGHYLEGRVASIDALLLHSTKTSPRNREHCFLFADNYRFIELGHSCQHRGVTNVSTNNASRIFRKTE